MKKIIFKVVQNGHLRNEIGIKEKNDCVVRSLASALDIPYKESHQIFKTRAKRKNGDGVYFDLFMKSNRIWLQDRYKVGLWETNRFKTYYQIIKSDPEGCYLAMTSSHVTTIKKGCIVDICKKNRRPRNSRVELAWKVIEWP